MKFPLALITGLLVLHGAAQADTPSGIGKEGFDPTVRPQDDIYHAVNGGWIKQTVLPPEEAHIGAFKTLYDLNQLRSRQIIENAAAHPADSAEAQKIGDLYHSFMDEARIERLGLTPLQPQLARIAALRNKAQLVALLGQWQSEPLETPLGLYVEPDAKNSRATLAGVYQSGLAMPDRDYYLEKDARFEHARQAYLRYLTALFRQAQFSHPAQRAQTVFQLERQLAQLQWSKVDNRDPQKTYNKLTLAQLAQLAPGIDWPSFFAQAGVPQLAELNVAQPGYVSALAKLINSQPLASWQDYLTSRLLDGYAPYLNKAMVTARFEFYGKALAGTQQQRPRWKRAVATVEDSLGEAIGKLYVQHYFPPAAKARMLQLVDNLMAAYRQSIDTLSWMSPATRAAAQRKLSQYTLKIGYPDKWKDYSSLTISANDLVGNIQHASAFRYREMIKKLGKPVDRSEWGMTPQTVNAYYNPTLNEIVFPAAILQPPFFDMQADDAANYGGIGAVIGHEISHGFDDQGSQFDGDGNLNNWWTAEDRARFQALTAKLVAQYNGYEALPGKHINGQLTLGENIADNAGLQIAYKAYQLSLAGKPAPVIDGMTGDQRFFYGFAQVWRSKTRDAALLSQLVSDPHSPEPFRAIGASANSDAFFRAFDVHPGDRMYKAPADRIRLW
ncbi:MAG TPA: M13 family metallopeptidase [Chromobacteriaceae bacterium]|nr:M13 family metallopeptidase [Chromobacteriaceae bacterium]